MKHSHLSNDNATTEANRAIDFSALRIGRVDTVQPTEGRVDVRLSENNHVVCEVAVSTSGDQWLPSVDDRVVIGERNDGDPQILATYEETASIGEGERLIGHAASDTRLYFQSDGTIFVFVDGNTNPTLIIDDDGLQFADETVMTDVNLTTDADGHVTDVTPIYTTSISL